MQNKNIQCKVNDFKWSGKNVQTNCRLADDLVYNLSNVNDNACLRLLDQICLSV